MNLKSFRLSPNFLIIIGTLIFLALVYIFYMNYYVASKENRIISTRFRVLEQLGDNVNNKATSYSKNAKLLDYKIKKQIEVDDSIYRIEKWNKSKETYFNAVVDYINRKDHINKDLSIVEILSYNPNNKDSNYEKERGYYYLDDITIDIKYPAIKGYIIVRTDYHNLIKGLERNDVFDGILIFRDSTIVYNTLGQDILLSLTKLKSDPAIDKTIKFFEEDNKTDSKHSLLLFPGKEAPYAGTIYSGEMTDVVISNTPYKLLIKPINVLGETWYMGGLMKVENFNGAKRSIPPLVVIALSVLLILIIFSLPIIKLQVISKIEQLDTGTVINSAMSLLLGGSIIVLFLFFITQNVSRILNTDNQLQELSKTVSDSLNKEIFDAYGQLELYDKNHKQITAENSPNPENKDIWVDVINSREEYPINYPSKYPYYDFTFWVNESGKQTLEITPFKEATQLISVKSRDYFNKKDEWFLPGSANKKFRIESILSLTTGNHKVALSKKSVGNENEVVGLTSRFYSIIDPILPQDYSFCIIDETGKVWFHSDKNHNLMENLLSESNDDKSLASAIYSKNDLTFSLNYYNKPHRAHIAQIDNLPLYMVTLYNQEAEKSFHAQVFTLTLMLLAGFFFIMVLQAIFLLSVERMLQWSLNKNLIMTLTRPMSHLNDEYIYLTWMNGILFLITIPFVIYLTDQQAISSTFVLQVILFGYAHWILNDNPLKKRQRQWFAAFNILLIFVINLLSFVLMKGQGYLGVVYFQFVILVAIAILDYFLKSRKLKLASDYNKNYAIFLLTIILFFGIIPSLKFYESAYNTEYELRIKHNQFDLMKKYEAKNEKLIDYYKTIDTTKVTDSLHKERRTKGVYTSFLNNTSFIPYNDSIYSEIKTNRIPENYWNLLIYLFRPFYDDYISENKSITYNNLSNDSIRWSRIGSDIYLKYQSNTEDLRKQSSQPKVIKSEAEWLRFIFPFRTRGYRGMEVIQQVGFNGLFWLIVLAILFGLFHMIKFATTRIFSLNIIEFYSHQSFGDILRNQILANKDVLIVRQSSVDVTSALAHDILQEKNSISIDWSNEDEINSTMKRVNDLLSEVKKNNIQNGDSKKGSTSVTIFIDHISWNFNDRVTFNSKLAMVRDLMGREDIRLIMLSQIHPITILNYYGNLIEEAKTGDTKYEEWLKLFKNLQHLIDTLIIEPLPINYNRSWIENKKDCKQKAKMISVPSLIALEMSASDYLLQFEKAILDYNKRHCTTANCSNPEERIINKIISLAGKYYKDLLDSCSYEEKFVLYDYADDMIMNPKNEAVIYKLLEKGLLVKKCDKINFMNISFRRYVLASLNKSTAKEIEVKMGKESGTWQGYRATLIIIIIALFGFIAMANQNFLDNLNQLFVAIGGGVAVITGLIGLISRNKSSGTAP